MNSENYQDNDDARKTEIDELESALNLHSEDFSPGVERDLPPVESKQVLKNWTAQDFSNIYVMHKSQLTAYARKFVNDWNTAEEVVQDAFLYLMVSLPELDSEAGVVRYLRWKTRLLCFDVLNSNKRSITLESQEMEAALPSDEPDFNLAMEQAEDAAIVQLALAKLLPRHREVLIASVFEEKSISQVSAQVNLSENATRQLLLRARLALRHALVGEAETSGMSISQILSIAARKAATNVAKNGAAVTSFLVLMALGGFTFLSGNFWMRDTAPSTQNQLASGFESATPSSDPEVAQVPAGAEPGAETASSTTIEVKPSFSEPVNIAENSSETVIENEILEPFPEEIAGNEIAPSTEFALFRSPFDPWLVDSIFESSISNEAVLESTASENTEVRRHYTVLTDQALWIDFDYEPLGATPILNAEMGVLVAGNQFFIRLTQVDFLVEPSGNDSDVIVFTGVTQALEDQYGNSFPDSVLSNAPIRLRIELDKNSGDVITDRISLTVG